MKTKSTYLAHLNIKKNVLNESGFEPPQGSPTQQRSLLLPPMNLTRKVENDLSNE